MGYVRVATLALFLLATSTMFPMKKIEAATCRGSCTRDDRTPCTSQGRGCFCDFVGERYIGSCIFISASASGKKMIDEHPNLCKSDEECMKKGSGNFCALYPNTDYGWCFNSDSEELKSFLAMPRAISK